MQHAVGIIEMKNVARAVLVADTCIKTAAVSIQARTTCPGKFLIILTGEISAVQSAVEAGLHAAKGEVTDTVVLGNIDESVIPALAGTAAIQERGALGVVETFTIPGAIKAADLAAKTAQVNILELRAAQGLGGKGIVYFTGSIGAVKMAVDAVKDTFASEGTLLDAVAIAAPDDKLWSLII